jgi:hypothetical protein
VVRTSSKARFRSGSPKLELAMKGDLIRFRAPSTS